MATSLIRIAFKTKKPTIERSNPCEVAQVERRPEVHRIAEVLKVVLAFLLLLLQLLIVMVTSALFSTVHLLLALNRPPHIATFTGKTPLENSTTEEAHPVPIAATQFLLEVLLLHLQHTLTVTMAITTTATLGNLLTGIVVENQSIDLPTAATTSPIIELEAATMIVNVAPTLIVPRLHEEVEWALLLNLATMNFEVGREVIDDPQVLPLQALLDKSELAQHILLLNRQFDFPMTRSLEPAKRLHLRLKEVGG